MIEKMDKIIALLEEIVGYDIEQVDLSSCEDVHDVLKKSSELVMQVEQLKGHCILMSIKHTKFHNDDGDFKINENKFSEN